MFVSIFRPKARHRGYTYGCHQAWGWMCNPATQPHCLHQQGLLRHAGHPVESTEFAGSECKDRLSAQVCMWHGGEQLPQREGGSPSEGPLSRAADFSPTTFPFSPSFLPGAGVLDGIHCVLNLALKSLGSELPDFTGRLGRPEYWARGVSPCANEHLEAAVLPGRTGCAGDSLQRWALGSRWALPLEPARCTLHPGPGLVPTVQCCQALGSLGLLQCFLLPIKCKVD